MTEPSRAVFLSYASQDAEAAKRICEALRVGGIEVWFDQSELRGGDAWDHHIRRQIADCALFVPLISAHTQARAEGYFRLEWDLADQRSHMMARSKAFIIPLCVDDTPDRGAEVPESFLKVQWTRLPAGATPTTFVERISRLLSPETAQAPAEVTSPAAATPRTAAASRQPRPGPAKSRQTQRVVLVIVAVAAIGLGYLAVDKFILSKRSAAGTQISAPSSQPTSVGQRAIPEKSIAVLPFLDMSEKHDQEYFSDGLAEELLDLLAKIPGLHVIARTSSFSFKGKSDDIPTIAKKLNVSNILEGSVRKSGTRLRVTTQLIRTDNGEHLWSETYDREMSDTFKIQDEIAAAVVGALKVRLASPSEALASIPTLVPAAYDQFLRGKQQSYLRTDAGDKAALAAFKEATKLDPNFAAAYAAMSVAETHYAEGTDDRAGYERGRIAAEKALVLDPELMDGYRARALYRLFTLDIAGAQADLERAIRLAPNDSRPLSLYGATLEYFGHVQQAIDTEQQALALDPLNPLAWHWLGLFLRDQGDYPAARRAFERAQAFTPDSESPRESLLTLDVLDGRAEGARAGFTQMLDEATRAWGIAVSEHSLGHAAESERALQELIVHHAQDNAYQIATAYAWRGEQDKAMEWLDRAYRQRESGLGDVKVSPFLASARGDPRFKAILRKMKLPE